MSILWLPPGDEFRRYTSLLGRALEPIGRLGATGDRDECIFCGHVADVTHNLPELLLQWATFERERFQASASGMRGWIVSEQAAGMGLAVRPELVEEWDRIFGEFSAAPARPKPSLLGRWRSRTTSVRVAAGRVSDPILPPPDSTLLAVLTACYWAMLEIRNRGLGGDVSAAVQFSQVARVLHPIVSALPDWEQFDPQAAIAEIARLRRELRAEELPWWNRTIGPLTGAQVPLAARERY